MTTKYRHYNKSASHQNITNALEYILSKIDSNELRKKIGRQKSIFIAENIRSYFDIENIEATVTAEVSFVDGRRDSIDVLIDINNINCEIIIEIDNLRADQVAKKLLSRTSRHTEKHLIYVTLCYDSKSAKGHKSECLKYIEYHFNNYFKINNNVEYMAYIPKKYTL